jgi:hypothetical protein
MKISFPKVSFRKCDLFTADFITKQRTKKKERAENYACSFFAGKTGSPRGPIILIQIEQ